MNWQHSDWIIVLFAVAWAIGSAAIIFLSIKKTDYDNRATNRKKQNWNKTAVQSNTLSKKNNVDPVFWG